MTKKIIFPATALVLLTALTGCLKEDLFTADNPADEAFRNIKAPDNFSWETTGAITLHFHGQAGDTRVGVLQVATPNGPVFCKKWQKAGENDSFQLTLPSYTDQVEVRFGGIAKTLTIENNTATFNLDYPPPTFRISTTHYEQQNYFRYPGGSCIAVFGPFRSTNARIELRIGQSRHRAKQLLGIRRR